MEERECLELIRRDSTLTTFQKKVLTVVAGIPRGEVRTYGWVAERAGHSGAARAVGGALAKNPYCPEIPCHRVVCSNGSIGGYSGGVFRKKRLLADEGVWPVVPRRLLKR